MNVSKPTVKRWENVNDTLSVVVAVIVVVLFLIASIKIISYLAFAEATVDRYMSKNCSELEQSGLEARWEYGKGCLVNIDGHWVPERKSQNKRFKKPLLLAAQLSFQIQSAPSAAAFARRCPSRQRRRQDLRQTRAAGSGVRSQQRLQSARVTIGERVFALYQSKSRCAAIMSK
jgi:hypothetical protein